MQVDPTNLELYRLAIADAPFVIWAYAILWVAFVVYLTMVLRRLIGLEKEIQVLESAVSRRDKAAE